MTPREALLARAVEWFAAHGIGDTSLRGIADGLGTSHRMLIHHFGGRDGLLLAVVEQVEADQRRTLAALAAAGQGGDPVAVGQKFWAQLCDTAEVYGPLFFELTAAAMRGTDYALGLRGVVDLWLEPITDLWLDLGTSPATARRLARLSLAVARGLLHDLLLSGDRAGVDAAMESWLDLLAQQAARDGLPSTAP